MNYITLPLKHLYTSVVMIKTKFVYHYIVGLVSVRRNLVPLLDK